MHIIFTPGNGYPMLLDTKDNLRSLHARLSAFLDSSADAEDFAASVDGSAAPYSKFLSGLRLIKDSGTVRLTLRNDGWLVLEGTTAELAKCIRQFLLEEDGHTHLYTKPVSLIIEADSTWAQ